MSILIKSIATHVADPFLSAFKFANISYTRVVSITIPNFKNVYYPKLMTLQISNKGICINADLTSYNICINTNQVLKIQRLKTNTLILRNKSTQVDILETKSLDLEYLVENNSVIITSHITGNRYCHQSRYHLY